jgi:hypothetical protein
MRLPLFRWSAHFSKTLALQPRVPLLLGPLFAIILFSSTALLTGMTAISLNGPTASDLSVVWQFSHPEQCVFCYGSNSTPRMFAQQVHTGNSNVIRSQWRRQLGRRLCRPRSDQRGQVDEQVSILWISITTKKVFGEILSLNFGQILSFNFGQILSLNFGQILI